VSKLAVMNQWTENWCQDNLSACCGRGKGVTIYVGDSAGAPDTTNDKVCASAVDFRCASGLHDIPCTGGVHTGRYVKIWRNDRLSICEARVYGPVEDGVSPSSLVPLATTAEQSSWISLDLGRSQQVKSVLIASPSDRLTPIIR
jgi:hypothetical protein